MSFLRDLITLLIFQQVVGLLIMNYVIGFILYKDILQDIDELSGKVLG